MRDLGLPWAMTAAGLHHHLGLRTTGLVSNDNTELLRCTSAPPHRHNDQEILERGRGMTVARMMEAHVHVAPAPARNWPRVLHCRVRRITQSVVAGCVQIQLFLHVQIRN